MKGSALKTAEVCDLLRIDRQTLRRRMNDTPPDVDRPWVNVGSARRPVYRWDPTRITSWLEEVQAWQASTNETDGSGSGGGTRTGPPARARSPREKRRGGSGGRSKPASPPDDGGNLLTLARSLDSKKP